jgi:hypothetical protein
MPFDSGSDIPLPEAAGAKHTPCPWHPLLDTANCSFCDFLETERRVTRNRAVSSLAIIELANLDYAGHSTARARAQELYADMQNKMRQAFDEAALRGIERLKRCEPLIDKTPVESLLTWFETHALFLTGGAEGEQRENPFEIMLMDRQFTLDWLGWGRAEYRGEQPN